MLKVNHVTKSFGHVVANDDLSFEVNSGQIAVLLGPNGAGKSTIIKSICGLLRYKGDITIDGHHNKSTAAKKVLGYVPEMPALYPLLTVSEHLEFIARAYNLSDWEEYADHLLTRFELSDKSNKLGKELSKGMQQKVSICCALLPRPKVVVFDEPMVGLDPHAIKELKEVFVALRDAGSCVLISTHMLDSVEGLWDVAHIMMNGNFAATRSKENLATLGESLEELFFNITEKKGDLA
ncbi:MAG: ABC transporter ATP-binding protein [Cellulosilyticaceae bacterium]